MKKHKLFNGDVVDIFLKNQFQKEYLGKAELIEFINFGLPYVLDDTINDAYTITFIDEIWKVKFKESTQYSLGFEKIMPIRTIDKIGKSYRGNPEVDIDSNKSYYNVNDSYDFLILDDYDTSIWDKRVDQTQVSGQVY